MTVQELQTALLNLIMNERLDPNTTSVIFNDPDSGELIAVNSILFSNSGYEPTIILKPDRKKG